MNTIISYVLLLLNIILLVCGQILFKLGLQSSGGLHWIKMLSSVHIWSGLFLYGLATLLWFAVLSRLPLSVAYPLQSLAYVLALIPAVFLFHETINATKVIGVAVIIVGAYLIVK
ncbi:MULTISPECIES: EamA family transporter [Paenibacillus]|uniref:Membrane protein n=1 Tax=Paenibacillus azoreducens TaxID=116718 RepID=A0A919YEW6_9BACL|nr:MULTISPECIES: EamA family transporter [Paenibacillus]MBE9913307.1 EamA family transporter [Paenibacillus donghaensis]GIO47182.1 membrane protein [Paenibacillus azoreducens]